MYKVHATVAARRTWKVELKKIRRRKFSHFANRRRRFFVTFYRADAYIDHNPTSSIRRAIVVTHFPTGFYRVQEKTFFVGHFVRSIFDNSVGTTLRTK